MSQGKLDLIFTGPKGSGNLAGNGFTICVKTFKKARILRKNGIRKNGQLFDVFIMIINGDLTIDLGIMCGSIKNFTINLKRKENIFKLGAKMQISKF